MLTVTFNFLRKFPTKYKTNQNQRYPDNVFPYFIAVIITATVTPPTTVIVAVTKLLL